MGVHWRILLLLEGMLEAHLRFALGAEKNNLRGKSGSPPTRQQLLLVLFHYAGAVGNFGVPNTRGGCLLVLEAGGTFRKKKSRKGGSGLTAAAVVMDLKPCWLCLWSR